MEVRIFDGGDPDIGILEYHSDARIVSAEQLAYGNGIGSVAYPDLRAHGEELQQTLDAGLRPWRAINVDKLGAIQIIDHAHQGRQTSGMVAMRMGDEDVIDIAEARSKPDQTASHPIPRVDEIWDAIHDQQVR